MNCNKIWTGYTNINLILKVCKNQYWSILSISTTFLDKNSNDQNPNDKIQIDQIERVQTIKSKVMKIQVVEFKETKRQ